MKTKFAIAFYYIAIGFLVACAAVIVVKLIFWPPCTQTVNTCAIDPWSTAGLAGTVLAVSATVLAILGAVAVAAWWTSLNDRVNEQVQNLYESQKSEVNRQVDLLLNEQQRKVNAQLRELISSFDPVKDSILQTEERSKLTAQNIDASVKKLDEMLVVLGSLKMDNVKVQETFKRLADVKEAPAEKAIDDYVEM